MDFFHFTAYNAVVATGFLLCVYLLRQIATNTRKRGR